MKNAASLKTKPDTPKTPGGISKSLLTPCRRVGLSRNWKKPSASPFNSPLCNAEVKQDNVVTRKRKESVGESLQDTANEALEVGTPTRKIEVPRRKKSKTLIASITNTEPPSTPEPERNEKEGIEECEDLIENARENENDDSTILKLKTFATPERLTSKSKSKEGSKEVIVHEKDSTIAEVVSTPVRVKSKSKKKISPKCIKLNDKTDSNRSTKDAVTNDKELKELDNKHNKGIVPKNPEILVTDIKSDINMIEIIDCDKSMVKKTNPNNLTKECVVVIQKKIFKKELKENTMSKLNNDRSKQTTVSQALFEDSDSDDVPLKCLNKTETTKLNDVVTVEDDDFAATSKPKITRSNKSINKKLSSNVNVSKQKNTKLNSQLHNPPSQSSDDDDFFEKKRTILVRKSYDKVTKPSKAKSTGSITQKDIEDLKARIESKKKMLLAESMADTKELRELIKKWQKGCQDALVELMDLMKNKCSDQNMDYSQILQMLKIPAALVGYDSDNDCFVTPDDENIILSHIKKC